MTDWAGFGSYIPVLGAAVVLALVLWAANWWLLARRPDLGAESRLPRQLMMFLLATIGLLLVLLVLPISDTARGQVLSLLGVVLTGIIAFSSTTLVANAMAGLMLRMTRAFRAGDFIRIGEHFGRVAERGLFHIEIQTEDRDLTTFPNLYLVTNPVTVVRSSGTIISATLSLGYDVPRVRVEELLKKAAREMKLQEPFVQVRTLGDFSVSYRVAGFLPDVKHLITARSTLHKKVMDVFHGAGIEIVSPTFMNQRRVQEGARIIPEVGREEEERKVEGEEAPETVIFDKAEEAEQIELLREEYEDLAQKLEDMKESRQAATEDEKSRLDSEMESIERSMKDISLRLSNEGDD